MVPDKQRNAKTMKKRFGFYLLQLSNVFPPYQGREGEMIPCIVTDAGGHFVASMDVPAIIWETLPE